MRQLCPGVQTVFRIFTMEYRQLGHSGLKVPVLSLGTGTFGGAGEFFSKWGTTDAKGATRLVDVCLEHGLTLFDTANIYSQGASEDVLGAAIKGRRGKTLISTKATFAMGDDPNSVGSSRFHIINACEASLKRLGTDYIDLYFMHGFDALTPVEETLAALDNLVSSGKIRYAGCSNFSGWHTMKSLAASEKHHLTRYVAYQGYYSLIGREYEWELMPLGLDQGLGLMVWSPLGWGRLTGKIKRGQPAKDGRIAQGGAEGGPMVDDEHLYTCRRRR
jgi:aryl-alcohol dehydrogenase-like predicted oxidoreductase